jgi:hypothetical protein
MGREKVGKSPIMNHDENHENSKPVRLVQSTVRRAAASLLT